MARFTVDDFREVKEAIKAEPKESNPSIAATTGWSAETVRMARKARSFKQYKELVSR